MSMAAQLSAEIARAAERIGPAVVQVRMERPGSRGGLGSGILLPGGEHVVTNAHVVEGAAGVQLTYHDGVSRRGEVLALDGLYDLAVVRTRSHLESGATFAEEDSLRPGHLVVAVGNPFGFGWSVTLGVVSSVDRALPGYAGVPLDGLIQTDAAINPGNSGGPLIDLEERVVGITTAILASGQNLGFAIPASTVQRVAGQLLARGRAAHPWVGIAGQNEAVDPALANLLGLPARQGVTVVELAPGGPAEAAGVAPFDLIIAVNDQQVTSISVLKKILRSLMPGDRIVLTVVRQGQVRQLPLRVAELPPTPRRSGR